ncbi:hypothetical protein COU89_01590 [Candidatus Roizmanbacteria bacterium CG10_big_fil_rev_8_21_14_0_10_45_7]|uniref:PpiC domain-containing protein n=1 Tax=Candidatus Roizmanbacteria bacterium CG10_big_fil_rev_8_21_14_0_10_45_7 TaxID=1974854 RepID=A0A2M8KV07_9BACT|nr:MAG: hypothetical protein COU89_01590 [Candidatus Roizmanbacteria bacterium CG10_big_fil_rev_8_21_14_0_10_45_7]
MSVPAKNKSLSSDTSSPAKSAAPSLPSQPSQPSSGRPMLPVVIIVLFLVGVTLIGALFWQGFLTFKDGKLGTGKAAVEVNGKTVSQREFDKRLSDQKYFYSNISKLSEEELAKMDEKVREDFIMDLLLTDFLKKNGIEVTNDEVKARLKTEIVDKVAGGDWAKYEQELASRYKTTLDQVLLTQRLTVLKEKLAQLQTKKHFWGIWVTKDMPQFARTEDLTPSGRAKLEKANASKKKKAEDALKRIQGGEDFAKVAAAVSEDSASSARGGDLGLIYLPKTNTKLAQSNLAAFPGASAIYSDFNSISSGQVKLVETLRDYVILKVTDETIGPLENKSFEEWYLDYRKNSGVKIGG